MASEHPRSTHPSAAGAVSGRRPHELDAIDQDPVDVSLLAEAMYPHVEQAAEVCAEEADRFLIEGFELAPCYPARLRAALAGTEVRACFLGHGSFSIADLAGYRGRSRSTTAHLRRTWVRPPAGSGGAASGCGTSAARPGCPTSTWARSVSRP